MNFFLLIRNEKVGKWNARKDMNYIKRHLALPSIIGEMKRIANPINVSNKRMCFNDETKLDSSFLDDAVPPHHFHLGEDI
ncbi:hypothetical protein NPIL_260681 [Nephila pilipes]|nr:hypothetical protein NPIL_260681 [Nephila pilipes]